MIFSGNDNSNQTGTLDYKALYQKERARTNELRNELEITRTQSKTYARELQHLFLHSKNQRQELNNVNNQLVCYAADLRTTLTDLRSTHNDLQEAYRDTIFRLVLASEYKDNDTGNHINRMSRYCTLLAKKLGLTPQQIENISYASLMHDVGKIGIPDRIILKKGMLTEKEFQVVKSHTTIGATILENARGAVLQTAQVIALSHHERWNGKGYPQGLHQEDIPLSARIVALTDTFDALTSFRPYKTPYPIDISCEIISAERGKHFDPAIVDCFLAHIDEFIAIKHEIDKIIPEATSSEVTLSERDLHYYPI